MCTVCKGLHDCGRTDVTEITLLLVVCGGFCSAAPLSSVIVAVEHRSKQQYLQLSDSWPEGTECCWKHPQSWWNGFERSCHSWQSLNLRSSARSTPKLPPASALPRLYSRMPCWTQMWHMTSSPSLQVFSPAMETGPVWSHSKLL